MKSIPVFFVIFVPPLCLCGEFFYFFFGPRMGNSFESVRAVFR